MLLWFISSALGAPFPGPCTADLQGKSAIEYDYSPAGTLVGWRYLQRDDISMQWLPDGTGVANSHCYICTIAIKQMCVAKPECDRERTSETVRRVIRTRVSERESRAEISYRDYQDHWDLTDVWTIEYDTDGLPKTLAHTLFQGRKSHSRWLFEWDNGRLQTYHRLRGKNGIRRETCRVDRDESGNPLHIWCLPEVLDANGTTPDVARMATWDAPGETSLEGRAWWRKATFDYSCWTQVPPTATVPTLCDLMWDAIPGCEHWFLPEDSASALATTSLPPTITDSLDVLSPPVPGEVTMISIPDDYLRRVRGSIGYHWGIGVGALQDVALPAPRVTVKLKLVIDANGKLVSAAVIESSGLQSIDEAAQTAARSASPWSTPPSSLLEDGQMVIDPLALEIVTEQAD